jgi:hypothetical protein
MRMDKQVRIPHYGFTLYTTKNGKQPSAFMDLGFGHLPQKIARSSDKIS